MSSVHADEDNDDTDDDTTFISTCHSVRFDAPVYQISNCIYHNIKKKAINCLAVAGRDGFIRIFESDAPFSSLFAFPIRYERVLSLDFLPKTSSFISIEHTADGSGNHVVIYEDWYRFPNLLKNVQVVEKGEDIIFNFVSSNGLPNNGYIAITSPGNMRLKSFQVEGINGESAFTFDVKIRTIQMSYDGTIISSNTIVNAKDNDPNKLQYISLINDEERERERKDGKRKNKSDITTYLVFELRAHKNIRLGPGAYRLSFPVAWKSRSRQRFRRELFGIEVCDENGVIIEAAQQLWIMDSDTATAAAQGYSTHPRYGGKISVCAENIRCLRKSRYIEQIKIFELDKKNSNKNNNDCIYNEDQSWFPSDFTTTTNDLNESISCMNVCKDSGRIVTCSKSLISIWDCDLIMRTYKIPHNNYIESDINQKVVIVDNYQQEKVSKYRLGATKGVKKKILQMITIRTPPLKILSLHASFIVRLLYIHCNYLVFASEHETRMVYLDIKNEIHKRDKEKEREYSSENDDEVIIDIYRKKGSKKRKKKKTVIEEAAPQTLDLSDTDSNASIAGTLKPNHEITKEKRSSTMHNVSVVFDDEGCPSIKHHAASFMLIPSIYEFNRFTSSEHDAKSVEYPFQMIGNFADHAHRIDLVNNPSYLAKKLIGNVVILDVSPNNMKFDIGGLNYTVIEKEILDRSQAMFDINNISMILHRRFRSSIRIRTLQIVEDNALLVATDDDVFVYDLTKRKLSYSLSFTALIIETYLYNTFLFVLTEKDINIYSSSPTEHGELLLLWSHPLLRMRGLKILPDNKFCLEFGSQTFIDRFSVNADGRRIRSHPFDLRSRVQYPTDPDKRPLTIFEQNSPKNILIFEWSQTSEMVLSLITKSHEAIITKTFERSRHLLVIALELIKIRKSYLYPLYCVNNKSIIKSEWQMIKQLKKECHGLLADVYVMQNKYDIAAQHYILSNRQFLQITQLFSQHIEKHKHTADPIQGLTLFYRLFLQHKSRIDDELNPLSWNNIMQHFKTYLPHSFSTIFLHPFMLNTAFNLVLAIQWLDECVINKDITICVLDPYASICSSTVNPTNIAIVCATHYLAKVVLLCLKNDIEAAQHTLSLVESPQFIVLLQSHKRLWLEWTHSATFRRLCSVTYPWEFARIVLDYAIVCYNENAKQLRTISIDDLECKSDISIIPKDVAIIEQLFPLPTLNLNESLQYFEHQTGGPSLMQCYLEGAVRYLVEQIDDFEAIQIESNRCLPESDNALYMKYLAELEEIGFTLIELYVQYLQKACYDDTTSILMGKEKPKRVIFERKRHIWNSQYPVILRPMPPWLNKLLQHEEEEEEHKNEQMMVMTRICTLLSCIELGASIKKRPSFIDDCSLSNQWKRRLDLLLASCPDITHKYINIITICGYVCCGCISDAISVVLCKEQSIITQFALIYCKSLNDWRVLLQQILKNIKENDCQLQYLQESSRIIWRHLARLSSLSTKQSEWLSVMDLISLVPDDGNLEFFAPIFSDLCRNQAGDALNMELFDRIVQIEKDKDYGFNQQMHEIFYPQYDQ